MARIGRPTHAIISLPGEISNTERARPARSTFDRRALIRFSGGRAAFTPSRSTNSPGVYERPIAANYLAELRQQFPSIRFRPVTPAPRIDARGSGTRKCLTRGARPLPVKPVAVIRDFQRGIIEPAGQPRNAVERRGKKDRGGNERADAVGEVTFN